MLWKLPPNVGVIPLLFVRKSKSFEWFSFDITEVSGSSSWNSGKGYLSKVRVLGGVATLTSPG